MELSKETIQEFRDLAEKKMNKKVSYKILIKLNNIYYKLGTIVISRFEGDIYYTLSQTGISNSTNNNVIGKIINHISWHKSGRVHIKKQNDGYDVCEEGVGVFKPKINFTSYKQEIKDIGFQEFVRDTIIDIKTLPEYTKIVKKLDVVFNIKDYKGPVQFDLTMISGSLVVPFIQDKNIPVKVSKSPTELLIDNTKRCLGNESGNADKMLQYGLYKYVGTDLKQGRRLFIANDSKIKKIN